MKTFKSLRRAHRALTALAVATVAAVVSPQAHAYDEDTHFYGTYSMARFSGIRHEAAMKLALSAQWMDESYISDPTSMILLPVTGVKKRRLLHFPSSRIVGQVNADAQRSVLGFEKISGVQKKAVEMIGKALGTENDFASVNFFTETQEDHPFASELLMQGMKDGDLMMAGASLHVLEDSFAHAGTPAEQGHAAFWHWPDRPFFSPEKYFRMTRTVFSAMVAIRAQLPQEALDCEVKVPHGSALPNCQMSVAELTKAYGAIPLVQKTVTYNVMKDPDYVKNALRDFYKRALKAKYLTMDEAQFEKMLAAVDINGEIDSFKALEALISDAARQQFTKKADLMDVKFILKDMGRLHSASSVEVMDYIDSYGVESGALSNMNSEGLKNFVHVMAHELLKWTVPAPLSDTHRMEIEDDKSSVRKTEMDIRIARMQTLITSLYGNKVVFIENNSKDDVGFGKEIRMEKDAEAVIPKTAGVSYATFSLAEKNRWDNMIFHYLFPNLTPKDLLNLTSVSEALRKLSNKEADFKAGVAKVDASDRSLTMKMYQKVQLGREYSQINGDLVGTMTTTLKIIVPLVKTFLKDTIDTHIVPSDDNYFYRNSRLFGQYRSENKLKAFLGANDAWSLEKLTAAPVKLETR